MVSMLTSRPGATDSLTGLLRLVQDPKTVQAHLDSIKKAEATHSASVAAARKELADAKTALDTARTAQDASAAALSKRESAITAREAEYTSKTTTLDEKRRKFEEWEKATSAELSQRAVNLANLDKTLAARDSQLSVREKQLAVAEKAFKTNAERREAALDERDNELSRAENDHSKRVAKLREALPVTSAVRNPISGIDQAFASLAAAGATGAGNVIYFSRPRRNLSMQVSFTSNPSPVKVTLEGSIDGTDFFTLATFDTGASGANGDIISIDTISVLIARANLITLTGGTTPKVTATIIATP